MTPSTEAGDLRVVLTVLRDDLGKTLHNDDMTLWPKGLRVREFPKVAA